LGWRQDDGFRVIDDMDFALSRKDRNSKHRPSEYKI
jgi:hypothetical protein